MERQPDFKVKERGSFTAPVSGLIPALGLG